MADLSQTIAIVFQGKDAATDEMRRVEAGLAAVEKAGADTVRVTDQLDGIPSKLGAIGAALAAAFGIASIAAFGQQFVEANVQVERFTRAVTQIAGSTGAADQELAYLKATADRLGLSVRDTSDAYLSLLAATKGTALEGAETRKIFEAVAGAMSALGKSSADTEGALLAVQQMISKGKVSAEELRGQLGERLPGAFAIAARAAGTTTQGLGEMLEAGQLLSEDFLPKFAAELQKTFGASDPVDGYTAALNRLKNAFDDALVTLGKTGAFDAVTESLKGLAVVAQSVGGGFDLLSTYFRATQNLLRGGSFETFNAELELVDARAGNLAMKLSGELNQSLAETERLTRQAADATASYGDQTDAETQRLIRQANAQTDALKATADAFKTLGVNPEKIKAGINDIIAAFGTLAKDPNVTGVQLLSGLDAALKRVTDQSGLDALRNAFGDAFTSGRVSVQEFDQALKLFRDRQEDVSKANTKTNDTLKRQSDEAKRAEEATQRMRLELEKLASDERIKLIEARVAINTEQIKADTERVKAAFESIDATVANTGQVIEKAFGMLSGGDWIDSSVRNKLFEQIDIENANRERALNLQAKLTEAQIEVLKRQADSLTRGDAMVKVDGTGLAPHLEAFMWEILRAIQVRVNQDGLKLLLGV